MGDRRDAQPNGSPRLPSTGAAAARVLALAESGTREPAALRRAVRGDPAMAVALLTAARACPHGDTPSDSVDAAIARLGSQRALGICLDFRLAQRCEAGGDDRVRHWRRCLLVVAYARALARHLRRPDARLIETAATLRDLEPLMAGRRTAAASLDAVRWLAGQGVSQRICALVRASHAPPDLSPRPVCVPSRCLTLAARMAEVWLRPDWERGLEQTHRLAQLLFRRAAQPFRVESCAREFCTWVFGVLGPQASDLEALLDIRIPDRREAADLYRRAATARAALGDALCQQG